jgi:hypothetical protein
MDVPPSVRIDLMLNPFLRLIFLALLIVFISPSDLFCQKKPRITKYETSTFL